VATTCGQQASGSFTTGSPLYWEQDGVELTNRTYEHNTTPTIRFWGHYNVTNITLNIPYFNYSTNFRMIYENTSGNYPYDFVFDVHGYTNSTNYVATNGVLPESNNQFNKWYNLEYVEFNLTSMTVSNGSAEDIRIFQNGVLREYLPGVLTNGVTRKMNFSDGTTTKGMMFSPAMEPVYLLINMSTKKPINVTMTIVGQPGDPVPFNSTEIFHNGSLNRNGTNTTSINNYFHLDDFDTDKLRYQTYGLLDTNTHISASNLWRMSSSLTGVCSGCTSSQASESTERGWTAFTHVNVNDYNGIGINMTCTASASGTNNGNFLAESTEGMAEIAVYVVNSADLNTLSSPITVRTAGLAPYSSNSGTFTWSGMTWLQRESKDSTTWRTYYESNTTGSYFTGGPPPMSIPGTVTIPSSGTQYLTVYQRVFTRAKYVGTSSASVNCDITDLYLRGVGPNSVGNNRVNNSFQATSNQLFVAGSSFTGATATVSGYNLNNANLNIYLSPNNGTTWERVDNNVYHFFTASGTAMRWRVNGTTIDNSSSYGVTQVDVNIITTTAENVTVKFGDINSVPLYSMTGQFNNTRVISLNETSTNYMSDYLSLQCPGQPSCIVPIIIQSQNVGGLSVTNISSYTNINPIRIYNLTPTILGDLQRFNITFNYKSEGSRNVSLTDYRTYFAGNKNDIFYNITYLQTTGSSTTLPGKFNARYSPYNITAVFRYLDFIPRRIPDYNITPYGQRPTRPYWNITSRTPEPIHIYTNTQVDLPNCVALRASNNSAQITPVIMNSTARKILELSNYRSGGMWYFLDYGYCNEAIPLDVIMNSVCQDCVITRDVGEWDGVNYWP
jgi:hypothetical protein